MSQAEDYANLAKFEKEIIQKLEALTNEMEKVFKKEDSFFQKAGKGVHRNKLLQNIADFEIFLEEDVQPTLRTLDTKMQDLGTRIQQMTIEQEEQEYHEDIQEHLSHALAEMEKEVTRFEKLLKKAENHLENGVDPENIANKIDEVERGESSKVLKDVEGHLGRAEKDIKRLLAAQP